MQSINLAGRSILVVEDEPLIALDIEVTFANACAIVHRARTLSDAHLLVEQNNPSAAVLDFRCGDGDAGALCAKLVARKIPFVIDSGDSQAPHEGALVVPKPARPGALIDAVAGQLSRKEIPHAESAQADQRCVV
jgi:DNA-binding response OmpR family regulator